MRHPHLPVFLLVTALACGTEPLQTPAEPDVQVNGPAFDLTDSDPVGFTGYSIPGQKLTHCGECHASQQGTWPATEHASALQDVLRTDFEQKFCRYCHSVNRLGNWVDEPAGYEAVPARRFADIQCESCHGPDPVHLADPEASLPLANLMVGTELSYGCGECHQGIHHPFVEQWTESGHAMVYPVVARREACDGCHEGRAALIETFLEPSNYVERDGPDPVPITCPVCHDSHGAGYAKDVRADVTDRSKANLCIRCHSHRGEPPHWRGPHGGEGLVLLAEDVGWMPPGFVSPGAHAHGAENAQLCVTCHMPRFSVYDPNGQFLLTSAGHLFTAVACLDSDGIPYKGDCALEERDFRACAECHADEASARAVYVGVRADLNALLDQIWVDEDADGVMDAYPEDSGVLAKVVALGDPTALDIWDEHVTVADGALWNALLAHTADRPAFEGGWVFGKEFGTPGHAAGGNGVHNPDLLRDLLEASIAAVVAEYLTP